MTSSSALFIYNPLFLCVRSISHVCQGITFYGDARALSIRRFQLQRRRITTSPSVFFLLSSFTRSLSTKLGKPTLVPEVFSLSEVPKARTSGETNARTRSASSHRSFAPSAPPRKKKKGLHLVIFHFDLAIWFSILHYMWCAPFPHMSLTLNITPP